MPKLKTSVAYNKTEPSGQSDYIQKLWIISGLIKCFRLLVILTFSHKVGQSACTGVRKMSELEKFIMTDFIFIHIFVSITSRTNHYRFICNSISSF